MMTPKTNIEAFDLVFDTVRDRLRKRPVGERSAAAWLSERLGISRQTIHSYGQRDGWPALLVPKLVKLTGLPPDHIRLPDAVPIDLPADIAEELMPIARSHHLGLADEVAQIMRWYLDSRGK